MPNHRSARVQLAFGQWRKENPRQQAIKRGVTGGGGEHDDERRDKCRREPEF
jgi:hypothetical protein